jgi:hypothetical protein
VARDEPDLLPRYRELFEGGSHAGRVFLIRVLGQTGGGRDGRLPESQAGRSVLCERARGDKQSPCPAPRRRGRPSEARGETV